MLSNKHWNPKTFPVIRVLSNLSFQPAEVGAYRHFKLFQTTQTTMGILPSGDRCAGTEYVKVPEEQDTLLSEKHIARSMWPIHHKGISTAKLAALALAIATIFIGALVWLSITAHLQNDRSSKSSKIYTDCGGNYSTAIAAGCIYDLMSPQWVPPECYNATLSKEHVSRVPQPIFFRWSNLTEPLSNDPLELSQYDSVWTHDEYHKVHCGYFLELAALAADVGFSSHQKVYLNGESVQIKHSRHCDDLLLSKGTSPGAVEISRPGGGLRCYAL
jgi:hypothetical protein